MKGLDPDLVFQLLVVADGYTPTYGPKRADPKAGPVTLTLTPHDLDRRDPALVLRGRVVDEQRRRVARAVISPSGYNKGTLGQFGRLKG